MTHRRQTIQMCLGKILAEALPEESPEPCTLLQAGNLGNVRKDNHVSLESGAGILASISKEPRAGIHMHLACWRQKMRHAARREGRHLSAPAITHRWHCADRR